MSASAARWRAFSARQSSPAGSGLPGALVASDGDEAPGAVVDRLEFAAISCGGCGGEGPQLVERVAVDRTAVSFGVVEVEIESVVGLEFVEPLETEIIRTPLENGETEGDVEVVGEEREILPGELILERFGGGGDDRRSVGQHRRDEIGERLAGAGAGLHNRMAVGFDGVGDGSRYIDLPLTALAARRQRGGDSLEGLGGEIGERHGGWHPMREPRRSGGARVGCPRGPRFARLGAHSAAHRVCDGRQRPLGAIAGPAPH